MVVIENESIVVVVQLISMMVVFSLFFILVVCGSISRICFSLIRFEKSYQEPEKYERLAEKSDKIANKSFKVLMPIAVFILLTLGLGRFPSSLYLWTLGASLLMGFAMIKATIQKTDLENVNLSKNTLTNIILEVSLGLSGLFLWGISVILIPALILTQL